METIRHFIQTGAGLTGCPNAPHNNFQTDNSQENIIADLKFGDLKVVTIMKRKRQLIRDNAFLNNSQIIQ